MDTLSQTKSPSDPGGCELGWEVVTSPMARVKRAQINGSYLTYTSHGNGDPVILVHGALGDYRSWSSQVHALSTRFRVISYSRRFHQLELPDDEASNYNFRVHADDLIALIETLELGRVHLVGHSYGGVVAALVAAQRPELVNKLVLAEPVLFSVLTDPHDLMSLKLHRIALNVVQKLIENRELSLAAREFVKIVEGKDMFDELAIEAMLVVNQNAHTLGPMLQTYFEPIELDPKAIKTPTLLITGDLSPRVYNSVVSELNKSLENSELFLLAGASHRLYMEQPVEFSHAVIEFLSRSGEPRS